MIVQVDFDEETLVRLKEDCEREKRPMKYQGNILVREALDARDKKVGRK